MKTKIFIAGHRGMVGSAIHRQLSTDPSLEILTADRAQLDLMDNTGVLKYFEDNRPNKVYLAAAKVGGIHANSTYPADFLYDNLMIECNVLNAAFKSKVGSVLFLGSSCIYPKFAEQPITETELLGGELEATNEPYAIAKIAGIKLCEAYRNQHGCDYRSVMPTNLYGPNDNFHPENSHVIPGLLRRFHLAISSKAEKMTIWGSGAPYREFLHVDDMAKACVHVMNLEETDYLEVTKGTSHINIGSGQDITIRELAELIAKISGFTGRLEFDTSKPDGTPRKLLDITRVRSSGWAPEITLADGLASTWSWYQQNVLQDPKLDAPS